MNPRCAYRAGGSKIHPERVEYLSDVPLEPIPLLDRDVARSSDLPWHILFRISLKVVR